MPRDIRDIRTPPMYPINEQQAEADIIAARWFGYTVIGAVVLAVAVLATFAR
jgi:hypothetical protein